MRAKFAGIKMNFEVPRPPLTPVSKGTEMLFLDYGNWFSAIIGMTFVNIMKASHFPGCFRNLRALRTYPIPPSLHNISYLKERNEDLYLQDPICRSHPAQTGRVSMSVRNCVCKPNKYWKKRSRTR